MTNLKLGWLKLLGEYVAAGCDIHGIRCDNESMSNRQRTPFLEVTYGFLNRCWVHVGTTSKGIEKLVQLYLHVLQNSRIDIVSYGQKEKELHDKPLVDKDFSYDFSPKNLHGAICRSASATWRLIGFTYGPSPEDWQIWGSLPTDDFLGEFWYMVENIREAMSGSWPG
jgi:hypothetical protein